MLISSFSRQDLTDNKKKYMVRRQKPQDTRNRKTLKLSASELTLNPFNANVIPLLVLFLCQLFIYSRLNTWKVWPITELKACHFFKCPLMFSRQTKGKHHKTDFILREILLLYDVNLKPVFPFASGYSMMLLKGNKNMLCACLTKLAYCHCTLR